MEMGRHIAVDLELEDIVAVGPEEDIVAGPEEDTVVGLEEGTAAGPEGGIVAGLVVDNHRLQQQQAQEFGAELEAELLVGEQIQREVALEQWAFPRPKHCYTHSHRI
jgi:hypothetical protein